MKRILYIISIPFLLASCGTAGILTDNTKEAVISSGKDQVACHLEKDTIVFQLGSLWNSTTDIPYPVITGNAAGSYESWTTFIEDKPEYRNMLSEKTYTHWQRTVTSLLRRHSANFDSFLFTVPGRVIAYTEKQTDVGKLHHRFDCAMTGYGSYTNRYRFLDFGYKPSLMEENPEKYIFRSVVKDKNMLIAIDRIWIEDSDLILCIMYTCMGKFDYVYNKDGVLHYKDPTSWKRFNPQKNIPMAFEFFYRQCDPISIEVIQYLFKH